MLLGLRVPQGAKVAKSATGTGNSTIQSLTESERGRPQRMWTALLIRASERGRKEVQATITKRSQVDNHHDVAIEKGLHTKRRC